MSRNTCDETAVTGINRKQNKICFVVALRENTLHDTEIINVNNAQRNHYKRSVLFSAWLFLLSQKHKKSYIISCLLSLSLSSSSSSSSSRTIIFIIIIIIITIIIIIIIIIVVIVFLTIITATSAPSLSSSLLTSSSWTPSLLSSPSSLPTPSPHSEYFVALIEIRKKN